MNENINNVSNLLNSLMGQVTEKQKEIYKKIKYAQGDLVISEIMEDSHSSDSDFEETLNNKMINAKISKEELFDSTVTVAPYVNYNETITENYLNCDTNIENWDSSLTFKYMNGDISFNELTNIMEKNLFDSNNQTSNVIIEEDFTETMNFLTEDEDDFSDEETNDNKPAEEFEKELLSKKSSRKSLNMKNLSSGFRKKKLAKDLVGLVGQANLHFARGDHEGAIKMCLEVIRLAPTSPEPFQTLSMIYEERKEWEKAYQYNLISAYLSPSDGENWIKVAEMAIELKKYSQAITCYSKAIKIYPNNLLLHLERCKLYELVDDKKKALDCYESLLNMINKEPNNQQKQEIALQIAKEIAKIHFFNKNIETSIKVMEENLDKYSGSIINEDVNLYLELLISSCQFVKALNVFKKYCGIKFKLNDEYIKEMTQEIIDEHRNEIEVILVYIELQIDLRSKLTVCLINLKILKNVKTLEKYIVKENPNEMGDLYLDIADAYIKINHFKDAEPVLKFLVNSKTYNCSSVWLKYARCLHSLNKLEASINAYYEVIKKSPKFIEAKLELSKILIEVGRVKDATEATGQLNNDQINLDLLLVRCNLLYKQKMYDEFIIAAKKLLSSEFTFLANESEMSVMITSTTYKTRIENLKEIHKEYGDKLDTSELSSYNYEYIGNRVSSDNLLDIFSKYCKTLYSKKKYCELTKTVFSAYTCSLFSEKEKFIDFIALNALTLIKNLEFSYSLAKSLIFKNINNNQIWNFFSVMMMRLYQDLRHNKFCLRLFVKNQNSLSLAYINGHNALTAGSYKLAMAEYVNIFKQNPNDPFAILCIVVGFTHLACQRFITNKHSVVAQLCAFMNLYLEVRGECQESLYNVARSFHQLGLVHEAVHFYKRALLIKDSIECDPNEKNHIFNLNQEISFNLSLIYLNSGNRHLAMYYTQKYFVV